MAPFGREERQWLPPWPRWRCGPPREPPCSLPWRASRGCCLRSTCFPPSRRNREVAFIRAAVPLPRPRPAEADKARNDKETDKPVPDEAAKAAEPAKPEPSACRLALTDAIAIAPSIPDIKGPGGCGGEDLVRLEAIVLPDKRQVPVKPAAILRCKMATAIADWIRTDMAPLAQGLGSAISELDNFNSFECRGRNRVAGAMLSEHGRANALDVRSLKLASGRAISLTDRSVPRDVARARAAFRLRAIPHRARARLRLVPRGSHPSRPDGAAKQLPDLPVECVGPAAADSTAVAGRAAGGRAAARGRRQVRGRQAAAKPEAAKSGEDEPEDKPAPAKKPTKKRR